VSVGGTSSKFCIRGEFQPLNPSKQSSELLALYQDSAAQDNVIINGEHSGGCADSGFIAAAGTPVICGVGPVGGNYHRPDEWMQIDSLAQRARFIANTILRLAHQPTISGL
jgi:glutamate carboxypeptidase